MNSTPVDTDAVLSIPATTRSIGPLLMTIAEPPASSRVVYSKEHADPEFFSAASRIPSSGQNGSSSVPEFLRRVLESRLVTLQELDSILSTHPTLFREDAAGLIQAFIDQGVLTNYQVTRILSGQTFGLVLGNYRIVERIGAGGMGVVYKAEHIHMKRAVAIKVLVSEEDDKSIFLQRFYSEMQATAVLSHPNIVLAFDAGEIAVPHNQNEVLRYLVMEYVPGKDLEQHVLDQGPLPVARACEYIRQAVSGLQHAYEHGLVHRDIKPSNLLLSPQHLVKILDFGLARLGRRRHTEAHTMLGSVDYMAPEQARDARSADIRADIYGLGGTLYWLLAGQKPFRGDRPLLEELLARQRESPLPLRKARPDVPLELEAIIYQMMALDPGDRYPTPLAVMTVLSAFLETAGSSGANRPFIPGKAVGGASFFLSAVSRGGEPASRTGPRLLVVSGQAKGRSPWRAVLEGNGFQCLEAATPSEIRETLGKHPCDLVLIDVQPAQAGGLDLCLDLRAEPPSPYLKIVALTPENTPEWLSACQKAGVDDCVARGVHPPEMVARIRSVLRIREAEERADRLGSHVLGINQQLDQTLRLRDADLYQAQDVLIFAMAKMAELRGLETGGHLLRLQSYVRVLAEEAARLPAFAGRIDATLVRMLERCVLLHDIGKVAVPDHILLKPGKFDPEERSVMESHTVVGAEILTAVARQHGASLAFLQMATDIVRHHHERYDGTGYPDRLAAEAIPLAARIVTISDVYDALRSKLVYKPSLTHSAAKRLLLEANPGQFDPALLVAFRHCEANFEQIFAQTKD